MNETTLQCVAGDACDRTAYARALGGERADALITDPPYCLLTRRRKGGELRDPKGRKIDRDPVVRFESVRDYRAFTERWLTLALEHLHPDAPLIIWTNFLGREPILQIATNVGRRHPWGEYVWAKRTTASRGNEELLRVYEVALVLMPSPPRPLPVDAPPPVWSVVAGYDDDGEATRWGSHPHHKPFGVLEPLIRMYAPVGARVLDPFAGSGSIPAAAARLSRVPVCIEKSPEWAERVTLRLNATDTR